MSDWTWKIERKVKNKIRSNELESPFLRDVSGTGRKKLYFFVSFFSNSRDLQKHLRIFHMKIDEWSPFVSKREYLQRNYFIAFVWFERESSFLYCETIEQEVTKRKTNTRTENFSFCRRSFDERVTFKMNRRMILRHSFFFLFHLFLSFAICLILRHRFGWQITSIA